MVADTSCNMSTNQPWRAAAVPQALSERFPDEFSDARWRPLVTFLNENPDMRRLSRLMGARILDFDPMAAVTPPNVRTFA